MLFGTSSGLVLQSPIKGGPSTLASLSLLPPSSEILLRFVRREGRKMKVWLVGLGLAFLVIIRAEDLDNLEHEKLLGMWHGVALATDCEKILKHRDEMKIVEATLTKLEDGGVKVASNMPTPHGCKHVEMTFQKQEDGKLVHECEWGTKVVDAMKTDYSSYGLVNIAKFKDGQKICNIISLFTREPVITGENAEMIKNAAKEAGMAEENIILFPQEVACRS